MEKFSEIELRLLRRLRGGRHIPVRGEDEAAAETLNRRVPCLVAMGPPPNPVVAITDAGSAALAREDALRQSPTPSPEHPDAER